MISARVASGDSSESPRATSRIASSSSSGPTPLPRNPLAPDRSAWKTYSSSSKVVSTSTFTPISAGSAMIALVAASPSISGIRMSISTTSTPPARDPVQRLPAGGRLADHLEVVGGFDQHPETGAQQGLVVGEQHAGRSNASDDRSGDVMTAGPSGAWRRRESAVGGRSGGAVAADAVHPLAHAQISPKPPVDPGLAGRHVRRSRRSRCWSPSTRERSRSVVEPNRHVGVPGVLADVGQRLLDSPVGDQVDRGRQRVRRAADHGVDRQPGRRGSRRSVRRSGRHAGRRLRGGKSSSGCSPGSRSTVTTACISDSTDRAAART